MKKYIATIETKNSVVSEFTLNASNLKEAKEIAYFRKRMEKMKGRASVRLSK